MSVEGHVSSDLPGFTIVGLPDAGSAPVARPGTRGTPLERADLAPPSDHGEPRPSGMRKGGAGLDLPVALTVLVASGALGAEALAGCGFVDKFGLDGSLRGRRSRPPRSR